MVKKSIILLFFCFSVQCIFSQNITLKKEDIIGRWVEVRETNNRIENLEYPVTYIFRENETFHLGEASDGIILFNIAGKYTIKEDTIKVIYLDMTLKPPVEEKAKQMLLKVTSIDKELLRILAIDYDYSFQLVLKKQNIIQ